MNQMKDLSEKLLQEGYSKEEQLVGALLGEQREIIAVLVNPHTQEHQRRAVVLALAAALAETFSVLFALMNADAQRMLTLSLRIRDELTAMRADTAPSDAGIPPASDNNRTLH